MKILTFKPSLVFLLSSLIVIVFIYPGLGHAYGGRHHGYYGQYGYRHHGYYRHYRHHYYGGHSYFPGRYYRRNRYDYPRRRYSKFRKSYYFSAPVYTQLNNNYAGQILSAQNVGIDSSAWQILKQGQYSKALTLFAQEAQSYPNSGVPKVGYALATASGGDLDRGIWAMRRAFRIDPDSLHYLQFDEKGHAVIDNLIRQYSSTGNGAEVDQAFMISALYYLKHDYITAKKSIASVQHYTGKRSSYANLQRLIDQQLQGQEN